MGVALFWQLATCSVSAWLFSTPLVSLLVSSSSLSQGSRLPCYLPLYSSPCFSVFCQTVLVYAIVCCSLPVVSCFRSGSSARSCALRYPRAFLGPSPSLEHGGLPSGPLFLSLGLSSGFAGFLTTATNSACYCYRSIWACWHSTLSQTVLWSVLSHLQSCHPQSPFILFNKVFDKPRNWIQPISWQNSLTSDGFSGIRSAPFRSRPTGSFVGPAFYPTQYHCPRSGHSECPSCWAPRSSRWSSAGRCTLGPRPPCWLSPWARTACQQSDGLQWRS